MTLIDFLNTDLIPDADLSLFCRLFIVETPGDVVRILVSFDPYFAAADLVTVEDDSVSARPASTDEDPGNTGLVTTDGDFDIMQRQSMGSHPVVQRLDMGSHLALVHCLSHIATNAHEILLSRIIRITRWIKGPQRGKQISKGFKKVDEPTYMKHAFLFKRALEDSVRHSELRLLHYICDDTREMLRIVNGFCQTGQG